MTVDDYYFLITICDHYLMATPLSPRFVPDPSLPPTVLQQILNLNARASWPRRPNNPIQSILSFDPTLSNPPVSQETLLIVDSFLASHHPGECCLLALRVILDRCGIDEASRFIQSLHQIPTIIPSAWFSSATDFLVIEIITDLATTTFAKSIWPWSSEIAAFVYQTLELTFGPSFYGRPKKHSGAARCRAVFRQCIQRMDDDTSIYCVWLFTQTNRAVIMTHPLFKELERVHRAKSLEVFRYCWATAFSFFCFFCYFLFFIVKIVAWGKTRTWACRWWRWRRTWA